MRLFLFIAMVSLMSCDSCLPESWRVPPKRKFEIMAIERHQMCVQDNPCGEMTTWCHRQSELYCLDAGYSKTCGNGEVEGSCGINVK